VYFWSRGQLFLGKVYKTKAVVRLPNHQLRSGFNIINLASDPKPGTGVLKWGWGGSATLTVRLGKNLIKQELKNVPVLVGMGHIFGPVILIWRTLGPMYVWNPLEVF
jgi:hypothetical protein